jgi:hypothetical protein
MRTFAGWIAIALALFAAAFNLVPGAVSMMGLLVSLIALAASLASVSTGHDKLFRATAIIVVLTVLLVNDALRIWDPLPVPWDVKLGLYAIVAVALALCGLAARRLKRPN